MVAKRRQSHPKATAKPDAFARATAGHPKAAHKARRCPSGRTTHPHRRIAKKTPAKRHSRSARKLPKKASPNGTAAYPTSIQRNFPDIFHTVKASSQREGTPSGSKGGSTEKSGGLLRAKKHGKSKAVSRRRNIFNIFRASRLPDLFIKQNIYQIK